jgi:hypothetical protein
MAGIRGNQAYLVAAKQTAKAAAPTAWTDKFFFTGGDLSPTSVKNQLQESDSNRNSGDDYTSETGAAGAPQVYVRDAGVHHLLEWALGAVAHTGSSPNYTHTVTPANTLPYVAFGQGIGGTLFEQFADCKVSQLDISATAGSPLQATATLSGRSATRLAAEWSAGLAPPADSTITGSPVYNYNEATVTLSGGATSLVGSFDLTINNNVTTQQTDDSIPYDVIEGTLEVTLGFDLIFENLTEYNLFNYPTGGLTQGSSVYTTSAVFDFSKGANNDIAFTFPKIAYQDFPVAPDPSGGPITVAVRARAQRHASGLISAVVKNQVAT